jgi:hypothetical protein
MNFGNLNQFKLNLEKEKGGLKLSVAARHAAETAFYGPGAKPDLGPDSTPAMRPVCSWVGPKALLGRSARACKAPIARAAWHSRRRLASRKRTSMTSRRAAMGSRAPAEQGFGGEFSPERAGAGGTAMVRLLSSGRTAAPAVR